MHLLQRHDVDYKPFLEKRSVGISPSDFKKQKNFKSSVHQSFLSSSIWDKELRGNRKKNSRKHGIQLDDVISDDKGKS
jgi:hypothetical protein